MNIILEKKIDKYIKELYNIIILKDLKHQLLILQTSNTKWIIK
jgi:hypothetical protein